MAHVQLSHFKEFGMRPFCDQIRLHFRDFFYGFNEGKWKSQFPCNRLICILDDKGESYISDNKERVKLSAGTMLLVPAFHEITHEQSCSMLHLSIHFSLEIYDGIDLLKSCDCLYYEKNEERIKMIRRMMVDPNPFLLTATIYTLCWNCISHLACTSNFSIERHLPVYSHYAPLFEYMLSHCHAGIDVEQMAEVMHMNKKTFTKKFIYDNGFSPKSFFNRILVRKTAEYLSSSDMTIREIAAHVRFCNEFYFSRFFKKHLGISPREYRQQYRLPENPGNPK